MYKVHVRSLHQLQRAAFRQCRRCVSLHIQSNEPNVKQCAVVNLRRPVKLIISPAFVEGLIAMALLLYNNVLVFCLPAYSCQLFLCVVFNFRSCRPSWQPRNCLRDWSSLWGATLLTVAPWLPTERFTMKEPSSPQRRTDLGRPELGKPV